MKGLLSALEKEAKILRGLCFVLFFSKHDVSLWHQYKVSELASWKTTYWISS